jgi:hypothetical protein
MKKQKYKYRTGSVYLKTNSDMDRTIDFKSLSRDLNDLLIVTDVYDNTFVIPSENILYIFYMDGVKK